MSIMVFDTETISLQKRFIYNVGYIIVTDNNEIIKKDLVIDQFYNNKELFETAYYSNKRPLYTSRLKGKTAKKLKWGYACKEMLKDIKKYDVTLAYAYNSPFDVDAFNFTCQWLKNKTNPLNDLVIIDILDLVYVITNTKEYKDFCDKNNFKTKHKPPRDKQTAEIVYSFLTNNIDYQEEHTALSDSLIEYEILKECLNKM